MSEGNPSDIALLKRATLGWSNRMLLHLFPLLLPLAVLVVTLVRRRQFPDPASRNLALILLVLCLTLRARRAFEFTSGRAI